MTTLAESFDLEPATERSSLATALSTIAWAVAAVAVLCVPAVTWAVWSWAL